MNNDIRSDYPKYVSAQNTGKNISMDKTVAQQFAPESENVKPIADSMEVLGALGHAQVNMENLCTNNGVKRCVEQYMQDPLYAKCWVDYCDNLIDRGYNLEDALAETDNFFSVLKDKNIYS